MAAALRFAGLDWDRGALVHPDERRILMVVAQLRWPRPWDWAQVLGPRSPLNPRFFAYGSLPLYLTRLAGAAARLEPERLYLAGRALAGLFDLLTVAAIYAIGRKLGGRRTGLLAAAFLAVAVLPIQLAHFATVDTLLTALSVLAVYAWMRVAESGSWRTGLLAGALSGLTLATKSSAFPLLLAGWVAWTVWTVKGARAPQAGRAIAGLGLSMLAVAIAFLLAEPYALIDWFRFGMALAQEGAMSQGLADVPYTRQYIGTLPYLYSLRELVVWSLGLPLGLAGLAGVVALVWRALGKRRAGDLVLLTWLASYFLVVGGSHAKFARYMAPLVPWLCLMAALLLNRLWQRAKMATHTTRNRDHISRIADCGLRTAYHTSCARFLATAVATATLVTTALYATAFAGLYLRPHPWLQASDWIRQEVPAGARLAVEVWDDPLPLPVGGEPAPSYELLWLDLYPPDNPGKLERLTTTLSEADYVVLSSQRLYGSIGRLPDRYPLTSAYYRLLFGERLGLRLVDVCSNYPRLGPLAIVDEPLTGTALPRPSLLDSLRPAPIVLNLGRADESYSVYDHPRTLIFQKEKWLSPAELRAIIEGEAMQPAISHK